MRTIHANPVYRRAASRTRIHSKETNPNIDAAKQTGGCDRGFLAGGRRTLASHPSPTCDRLTDLLQYDLLSRVPPVRGGNNFKIPDSSNPPVATNFKVCKSAICVHAVRRVAHTQATITTWPREFKDEPKQLNFNFVERGKQHVRVSNEHGRRH